MYEKAFEQKVADCLVGTRPISEIISELCEINDGRFALSIKGDSCLLYSQTDNEADRYDGHELITLASVAIHEIERLEDWGLITVFQVNPRDEIVIGNPSLVNDGRAAFSIHNEKLIRYIKYETYGGIHLEKYIEDGYKTQEEALSFENLNTAKKTLSKTRLSVWVAVVVFVLSAVLDIIHSL